MMNGHGQAIAANETRNIVLFPPARQVGKVREAAQTLLKKRSLAAANRFRSEIATRMFDELSALGLSEDEQDEVVGAFIAEVEREMAQLHFERIRLHL